LLADRCADRGDVCPHGVEVPGHRGSDVDHHVDLIGAGLHREARLVGLDRRKMLA
jgi:hypothetical protein